MIIEGGSLIELSYLIPAVGLFGFIRKAAGFIAKEAIGALPLGGTALRIVDSAGGLGGGGGGWLTK